MLLKKHHYSSLGPRQKAFVDELYKILLDFYKANHPDYGEHQDMLKFGALVHKKCCTEKWETIEKKYIKQLSLEERKKFLQDMKKIGAPKVVHKPPKPVNKIL